VNSRKPIRRTDHRAFCETERWELVADAVGRPVGHHLTYRLALHDGRMLRTRISRPINKNPYGPSLEGHILRDQLEVTRAEFWACVDEQRPPQRGPARPSRKEAIPFSVLRVLRDEMNVDETALKALTRQEALDLVSRHWSGLSGNGA
jgi:hypothetical protein